MNLFIASGFQSASGAFLPWKVECDALTRDDWETIASIVATKVKFGDVEGVPSGGTKFANALQPMRTRGPLLIVDDVLTTGGSMERQRHGREAIGIVLFCRANTWPAWVTPVWRFGLAEVEDNLRKAAGRL